MEEGIGMLLWLALELAVAGTGRVLVRVISCGNWRGQHDEQERRTHSAAGSLWFTRDGQRVFTQAGLRLTGLLFYVVLAITLIGNWN